MNAQIKPVAGTDRALILDVLRGFAVLGIFIANSEAFSLNMFATDTFSQSLPTVTIDGYVKKFIILFIDGKFYSLFSLLFGIGFSIILERNISSGRNPLVVFYRRLTILALLGLGHLLLLWPGDILFLYALIGMVLPLFRNFSNKLLLITSVVLILSPLAFDAVKVLTEGVFNPGYPLMQQALRLDELNGITEVNYRTFLIDNPTYQAVLNWNQGGFFWRFEGILSSNRIPKVLAMFLIGYVVGRQKIYLHPEKYTDLFKKIRLWGLIIGIPSGIAMIYFHDDKIYLPKAGGLFDTLCYALNVIPLSLVYATTFGLWWIDPVKQKRLGFLAPVGRMALTNYIFQTLCGVFIYYGIGFALALKFGPFYYSLIAIGIFGFQIFASTIWLRYFRFGPLEWIWRILTYGKVIPILK